jgi:hypothetical protein
LVVNRGNDTNKEPPIKAQVWVCRYRSVEHEARRQVAQDERDALEGRMSPIG